MERLLFDQKSILDFFSQYFTKKSLSDQAKQHEITITLYFGIKNVKWLLWEVMISRYIDKNY